MEKPRWKRGWPMKPGDYLIRLSVGDTVAMRLRRSFGEIDGQEKSGLDANDCCDGVFFIPPDVTPLDQYWGKALAHFGPVPAYRGKGTVS